MTQMNDRLNTDDTDKFLYRELSYKIIGICMEMHNEYGPHHNERIYHKLVEEYFERNKIKYLSKPKISVYFKESGKKIGCYEPDFLIVNVIILELKALPFVSGREEKQLVEYVKISPY